MHDVATVRPGESLPWAACEDEVLACRSAVSLLITASTPGGVEALARRVHAASERAGLPFVLVRSGDLPCDPEGLRETCSHLLDAAAGGSVLITEIEAMPPIAQDLLFELLTELQSARPSCATVRLISGATASIPDRITAGTFSARLFYRLNIIHLRPEDLPQRATG